MTVGEHHPTSNGRIPLLVLSLFDYSEERNSTILSTRLMILFSSAFCLAQISGCMSFEFTAASYRTQRKDPQMGAPILMADIMWKEEVKMRSWCRTD